MKKLSTRLKFSILYFDAKKNTRSNKIKCLFFLKSMIILSLLFFHITKIEKNVVDEIFNEIF